MSRPINVEVKTLAFPDESTYEGQVLETRSGGVPHGYGHMTTKDGFEMSGYFRDGKAKGPGRFTAPNGERFCGVWNKNSKRHGRGILVKAPAEDGSDGGVRKQLIEIYDDGKLLKRMNATGAPASATHWLPCAPAEYGSATPYVFPDAAPLTRRGMSADASNADVVDAPCNRYGHTAAFVPSPAASPSTSRHGPAKAEAKTPESASSSSSSISSPLSGLVFLYGGSTADEGARVVLLDDLWVLDLATMSWSRPTTTGTPPPALSGHSCTVVGSLLYIIGGQTGLAVSSAVYVLNTETGEWTCPISKSHGVNVVNHTATYIPEHEAIYVIVQSAVFKLDLHTHTWSTHDAKLSHFARVPMSVISHTAVAYGTSIIVHGGQIVGARPPASAREGKEFVQCSSDVRVLDTEKMVWSVPAVIPPVDLDNPDEEVKDPASASSFSAMAKQNDFSGLELGSWNTARCRHTATRMGNKIYYIGGWSSSNPALNVVDTSYLADVQVLDLNNWSWSSHFIRYPVCPPRADHVAVYVGDNKIFTLGGSNAATGDRGMWDLAVLNAGEDLRISLKKAAKAKAASTAPASTASASVSSSVAPSKTNVNSNPEAPSTPAHSPSSTSSSSSSSSSAASAATAAVGGGGAKPSAAAMAAAIMAQRAKWGRPAAPASALPGSRGNSADDHDGDDDGDNDGDDNEDGSLKPGTGSVLDAFRRNA